MLYAAGKGFGLGGRDRPSARTASGQWPRERLSVSLACRPGESKGQPCDREPRMGSVRGKLPGRRQTPFHFAPGPPLRRQQGRHPRSRRKEISGGAPVARFPFPQSRVASRTFDDRFLRPSRDLWPPPGLTFPCRGSRVSGQRFSPIVPAQGPRSGAKGKAERRGKRSGEPEVLGAKRGGEEWQGVGAESD
jgi:hypothetical protein